MQPPILAKRIRFLLFLTVPAFYVYGLNRLPLMGPDEPRYTEVAREMFVRGDPITPTLGGRGWLEKPALLYWMMMAGFGVFGVSEWSARLGPALSGAATFFIICYLLHFVRQKDITSKSKPSLWGAAALASCGGMLVFSRAASFDIVLTMTATSALASLFIADVESEVKRRRFALACFYVSVGLSLLAKGLLGIVIPTGVIGFYYLFQRAWPEKGIIRSTFWGVPLALLVGSSWYGPVIARNGWKFVDIFFIQQHFARFVSNKYHHPQPFYFYLPVMAMLSVPWAGFLGAGLAHARRWNWRPVNSVDKLRIFSLAWFVAPVIFFSISQSKLPAYVLPALPGAMLIAGEAVDEFLRFKRNKAAMFFTAMILAGMGFGGFIYNLRTGIASFACILAVIGPLVMAAIVALGWIEHRKLCVTSTVLAIFLSAGSVLYCAADEIGRRQSVRGLLELASERGYGSQRLLELHDIERTAEFYAAGRLAYGPEGEPMKLEGVNQVEDAARLGGPVLVLVPSKELWQLLDDRRLETEIIGDNGSHSLAAERLRDL